MNNHKNEEPVDWVTANNGKLPKWADGTIGWDGREDLHREYLKQYKFNNLDEYDDQVIHDKSNRTNIDRSDLDDLKEEIDEFEKLADGPFMKDRHVATLLSKVSSKKSLIKAQLKYMKDHNMEKTSLYKQLEGFAVRLESIQNRLKNI